MTIRIAAIEVSHWHALHDAAYLRHLIAMPDVELVATPLAARRSSIDQRARLRPSRSVNRPSLRARIVT